MQRSTMFIINLLVLGLGIVNLIGLIFMTQIVFKAKVASVNVGGISVSSSAACADDVSETKLVFAKILVVTLWLQIILVTAATLFAMYS